MKALLEGVVAIMVEDLDMWDEVGRMGKDKAGEGTL